MSDMSDKKSYSGEMQNLVAMGKTKGYLNFDEVNDALPEGDISPDDIDDVMDLFGEKDIQIIDEEEEFEDEEKTIDIHDDGSSRSPDPVRMYLHEMGSVSLLSREDETEIAKRIEAGQRQILNVIINSPVTVKEVIAIGRGLEDGSIRLKDVIDTGDNFDPDAKDDLDEPEEEPEVDPTAPSEDDAALTKTLEMIRDIERKQE